MMFIQSSILASEILEYLETVEKSIQLESLATLMGEPLHNIQMSIEILMDEGLVALDFRNNTIALVNVAEDVRRRHKEQMLLELEAAYI